MSVLELDLHPDTERLRRFGWIALAGFGLLAALAWLEWAVFSFGLGGARGPVSVGFAVLAVYAALASVLHPPANRPLWIGLVVLTFPIGFAFSYLILAVLFFGIITPAGLLLRLLGRDPLERRWDRDAASYWVAAREPRAKSAYFKQF